VHVSQQHFIPLHDRTDLLWMMLAIEVIIWQFDRIVEGFLPKVHEALTMHGVNSEYYAIQWWLG
jgi:hypothetical protein